MVEADNGLMVTLYCDKIKQMRTMGLDERQMSIVDYILEHGRVTNANVQEMFTFHVQTKTLNPRNRSSLRPSCTCHLCSIWVG